MGADFAATVSKNHSSKKDKTKKVHSNSTRGQSDGSSNNGRDSQGHSKKNKTPYQAYMGHYTSRNTQNVIQNFTGSRESLSSKSGTKVGTQSGKTIKKPTLNTHLNHQPTSKNTTSKLPNDLISPQATHQQPLSQISPSSTMQPVLSLL